MFTLFKSSHLLTQLVKTNDCRSRMQRQVTLYSTEKLRLVSTSTNSLWMASGTLLHIRRIQKRQKQVIHTCCKAIVDMLAKLQIFVETSGWQIRSCLL